MSDKLMIAYKDTVYLGKYVHRLLTNACVRIHVALHQSQNESQ